MGGRRLLRRHHGPRRRDAQSRAGQLQGLRGPLHLHERPRHGGRRRDAHPRRHAARRLERERLEARPLPHRQARRGRPLSAEARRMDGRYRPGGRFGDCRRDGCVRHGPRDRGGRRDAYGGPRRPPRPLGPPRAGCPHPHACGRRERDPAGAASGGPHRGKQLVRLPGRADRGRQARAERRHRDGERAGGRDRFRDGHHLQAALRRPRHLPHARGEDRRRHARTARRDHRRLWRTRNPPGLRERDG